VFVRPSPNVDEGKWQVSSGGGAVPLWARSGGELFYLTPANEMVSVPIDIRTTFAAREPEVLFKLGPEYRLTDVGVLPAFDISPDDQRFLMMRAVGASVERPLVLVENWFEELKDKAGSGND
jgi:hypothetical protein